jgi:hypothetical protein
MRRRKATTGVVRLERHNHHKPVIRYWIDGQMSCSRSDLIWVPTNVKELGLWKILFAGVPRNPMTRLDLLVAYLEVGSRGGERLCTAEHIAAVSAI